jgi:hypothetical protein
MCGGDDPFLRSNEGNGGKRKSLVQEMLMVKNMEKTKSAKGMFRTASSDNRVRFGSSGLLWDILVRGQAKRDKVNARMGGRKMSLNTEEKWKLGWQEDAIRQLDREVVVDRLMADLTIFWKSGDDPRRWKADGPEVLIGHMKKLRAYKHQIVCLKASVAEYCFKRFMLDNKEQYKAEKQEDRQARLKDFWVEYHSPHPVGKAEPRDLDSTLCRSASPSGNVKQILPWKDRPAKSKCSYGNWDWAQGSSEAERSPWPSTFASSWWSDWDTEAWGDTDLDTDDLFPEESTSPARHSPSLEMTQPATLPESSEFGFDPAFNIFNMKNQMRWWQGKKTEANDDFTLTQKRLRQSGSLPSLRTKAWRSGGGSFPPESASDFDGQDRGPFVLRRVSQLSREGREQLEPLRTPLRTPLPPIAHSFGEPRRGSSSRGTPSCGLGRPHVDLEPLEPLTANTESPPTPAVSSSADFGDEWPPTTGTINNVVRSRAGVKWADSASREYAKTCQKKGLVPALKPFMTGHSVQLKAPGQGLEDSDLEAVTFMLKSVAAEEIDLESNVALKDRSMISFIQCLRATGSALQRLSLKRCLGAGHRSMTAMVGMLEDQSAVRSLRQLDLSCLPMTMQVHSRMCAAIRRHPALVEVHVASTRLSGEGAQQCVHDLLRCPTLEILDIGWNSLSKSIFTEMGEFLSKRGRIKTLCVASCSSSSGKRDAVTAVCYLLELLSRNETITHLDVSVNLIDFRGAVILEDAVAASRQLKKIDISSNPLGILGFGACCDFLRSTNQVL